MMRAHVYRTEPGEWCAELRISGHPAGFVGVVDWCYASTWHRAMAFAAIGLKRGGFPNGPMSGERFPQHKAVRR